MKKFTISFLCLIFVVGIKPSQAYVPTEKGTFGDWKLFLDCRLSPYLTTTVNTTFKGKEINVYIQIEKPQPWEDWIAKYDIRADNQPVLNTPITLSFPDKRQETILSSSVPDAHSITISNPVSYFKDQASCTITFVDKTLGPVSITYSLVDFNEAFTALEKAQKEFEQQQKK